MFGGQVNDVQAAARSAGQQLHILRASNDGEIDAAFAAAAELRVGALLVASDPFFNSRRERLAELASRYAIPAIYELREYAAAGGLMSYGINLAEAYRLVGVYTGRILKGDKPAELPVQQLSEIRVHHQSQGCQGARHRGASRSVGTRRRSDRIGLILLQCASSGIGPFRRSPRRIHSGSD